MTKFIKKVLSIFVLLAIFFASFSAPIKANEAIKADIILNEIMNGDKDFLVLDSNGQDVTEDFFHDLDLSSKDNNQFEKCLKKYSVESITKNLDSKQLRTSKTVISSKLVNFYKNSVRQATVKYSASVNFSKNSSGNLSSVSSKMSYFNVSFSYKKSPTYSFSGTGTARKYNANTIEYNNTIRLLNMGKEICKITYKPVRIKV